MTVTIRGKEGEPEVQFNGVVVRPTIIINRPCYGPPSSLPHATITIGPVGIPPKDVAAFVAILRRAT